MSGAFLSLDRLDKTYHPGTSKAVAAVSDFSLDIERGEIVALLGSSGCGKTSTLRMIAGFEAVTAGPELPTGAACKIVAMRDAATFDVQALED